VDIYNNAKYKRDAGQAPEPQGFSKQLNPTKAKLRRM
jgi:hypothetical protein